LGLVLLCQGATAFITKSNRGARVGIGIGAELESTLLFSLAHMLQKATVTWLQKSQLKSLSMNYANVGISISLIVSISVGINYIQSV